jgi:hypothetical protein
LEQRGELEGRKKIKITETHMSMQLRRILSNRRKTVFYLSKALAEVREPIAPEN